MPRIGLVCEGGTDQAAIEHYVRQSLVSRGYSDVTFLKIPAHRDKTNPIHGWSMVLAWLSKTSGERNRYLASLFASDNPQKCDAIVVHLDADNLSESQFQDHVSKHYQTTVKDPKSPHHRGREIARIIRQIGNLSTSRNQSNNRRYVIAAAVESTETWCLTAFQAVHDNAERLSGLPLCEQFMTALHNFEQRPIRPFKKVSKDVRRRNKFCRNTADAASQIESQCYHYKKLISDLCQIV